MNRHRITLTVEIDRAALIDQLRFLTDAVYVDAHFNIVIDDLGPDEAEPDVTETGRWVHVGFDADHDVVPTTINDVPTSGQWTCIICARPIRWNGGSA